MIKFKHIRFLIEAYRDRLKQKGVSQSIVDYVETLKPAEKGKAISKLMANPKLELDDLKVEDIRVENKDDNFLILLTDPTTTSETDPNIPPGDYYRIIKKWWIEDETIRLPEDSHRVQAALTYYNENKRRFKTTYISKYEKFQHLEQEYLELADLKSDSKRQAIRDMKMKGATKLHDGPEWSVYAITTEEAACHYGQGTQWCTAATKGHNYADSYLQHGPLYIFINKLNDEKYQANYDFTMIMDAQDEDVEEPDDNPDILGVAIYVYSQNEGVEVAQDLGNALDVLMDDTKGHRIRDLEPLEIDMYIRRMTDDPTNSDDWIGAEAIDILMYRGGTINHEQELEELISKSGDASADYAYQKNDNKSDGIGWRFHSGELAILNDAKYIVHYTTYSMGTRWPEGEKRLLQLAERTASPEYLYKYFAMTYAREAGTRWLEAEDLMKNDTEVYRRYVTTLKTALDIDTPQDEYLAYMLEREDYRGLYILSVDVLKKRIPELEEMMIKGLKRGEDSELGLIEEYLQNFKFEMPEYINLLLSIADSQYRYSTAIYGYAAEIIPDQRHAGIEYYLKKNTGTGIRYAEYVLKKQWPEFEIAQAEKLTKLQNQNVNYGEILKALYRDYINSTEIHVSRVHPDLEKVFGDTNRDIAAQYALNIIQDRFPTDEGHEKIMSDMGHLMMTDNVRLYRNRYGNN